MHRWTSMVLFAVLSASPTSLCQKTQAAASNQQASITLSGAIFGGVTFVSNDSLVVSACGHPQNCELIAFNLRDGTLLRGAASQSIYITRFLAQSEINAIADKKLVFNGAIYSSNDFSVVRSFKRLDTTISLGGESVGFRDAGGWCIASVQDTDTCVRRGAGRLLALSRRVAVAETDDRIEFIDLQTNRKKVVASTRACALSAEALTDDLIVANACGAGRILAPDGSVRFDLGRFVLGYDRAETDGSGARLLLSRPLRNISAGQKGHEILQTLATFGPGAPDEEPNALQIQVFDMRSKRILLDQTVDLRSPHVIPAVAISSDGSRIAVANGDTLRILPVPETH